MKMKKLLSLILVALMILPFGVLASAAEDNKLDLPEMPKVTSDKVYYLAHGSTASDKTPAGANVVKTQGWDPVKFTTTPPDMFNALQTGGTYIACGKVYIGATCDIVATESPVLFTAYDAKNDINFISRNADGTPYIKDLDADGNEVNAGQLGMVMVADQGVVTFHGDVIFDNIVLLDRAGMERYMPTTYVVGSTGKMVITNTVEFAQMKAYLPALQVLEGGYLFLDALGFSSIAGNGVVVVGDTIKDQVNADTFKFFQGVVCSSDGTVLYNNKETNDGGADTDKNDAVTTDKADSGNKAPTPVTTTPATNKAPVTTAAAANNNAANNDDGGNGAMIGIIIGAVAVVAIGVVVVIVIKKKKAE